MKNIPNEIIWEILQYLKLNDITKCIQVNKRVYKVTKNDNFWRDVYNTRYYLKEDFTKKSQKKWKKILKEKICKEKKKKKKLKN